MFFKNYYLNSLHKNKPILKLKTAILSNLMSGWMFYAPFSAPYYD